MSVTIQSWGSYGVRDWCQRCRRYRWPTMLLLCLCNGCRFFSYFCHLPGDFTVVLMIVTYLHLSGGTFSGRQSRKWVTEWRHLLLLHIPHHFQALPRASASFSGLNVIFETLVEITATLSSDVLKLGFYFAIACAVVSFIWLFRSLFFGVWSCIFFYPCKLIVFNFCFVYDTNPNSTPCIETTIGQCLEELRENLSGCMQIFAYTTSWDSEFTFVMPKWILRSCTWQGEINRPTDFHPAQAKQKYIYLLDTF